MVWFSLTLEREKLLPMFVSTLNLNMLWSPLGIGTSLLILLKKVTVEFRRCSDVMGTVEITLLLLPSAPKFLNILTESQPFYILGTLIYVYGIW